MEYTQVIKDEDGNEIKVGTKVRYWDSLESDEFGEVIEISDFEGDVDDDTGRSIMNAPEVKVKFPDDGGTMAYATSEWTHTEGGWQVDADGDPEPEWHHAEGKCEELKVVKEPKMVLESGQTVEFRPGWNDPPTEAEIADVKKRWPDYFNRQDGPDA